MTKEELFCTFIEKGKCRKAAMEILDFFFFLQHHLTCGILVLCPGIRPMPLALEAQSLNQWTAREAPEFRFDECAPTGVKSADLLTP